MDVRLLTCPLNQICSMIYCIYLPNGLQKVLANSFTRSISHVDLVADQVYGDQDWHSVVRNQCLDYMVSNLLYSIQHVIFVINILIFFIIILIIIA